MARGRHRAGARFRAAGIRGGVWTDAVLSTAATRTRVSWDHLRGDDGLTLDLRGSPILADETRASVAWRVDALRGTRAVRVATDLDAAARPFDRADAEGAFRSAGWTLRVGKVRAVAARGGDPLQLGASGPAVAVRGSDALFGVGSYDAALVAGQFAGRARGATNFAAVDGGGRMTSKYGPLGVDLALRTNGRFVIDAREFGTGGAAHLRASTWLPLERAYATADTGDPWVHLTAPRVEAAAIAVQSEGDVPSSLPNGTRWIAAAGWANAIGRRATRASGELEAVGGVVGDNRRAAPVLRVRASADNPWVGLGADLARVVGPAGERGGSLVGHARLGSPLALCFEARVAERDGADPRLARLLIDPTVEPFEHFLASPGWTGGGRVGIPIGSRVTARAGADADAASHRIIATSGALEVHDPCNCVTVAQAERIGSVGTGSTFGLPSICPLRRNDGSSDGRGLQAISAHL